MINFFLTGLANFESEIYPTCIDMILSFTANINNKINWSFLYKSANHTAARCTVTSALKFGASSVSFSDLREEVAGEVSKSE